MLQVLAQVARHGCGALARADAEVESHFDFALEGVSVSPYAVGKPEALCLSREECFKRLRVIAEITAALRFAQAIGLAPEDAADEGGRRNLAVLLEDYE